MASRRFCGSLGSGRFPVVGFVRGLVWWSLCMGVVVGWVGVGVEGGDVGCRSSGL